MKECGPLRVWTDVDGTFEHSVFSSHQIFKHKPALSDTDEYLNILSAA